MRVAELIVPSIPNMILLSLYLLILIPLLKFIFTQFNVPGVSQLAATM